MGKLTVGLLRKRAEHNEGCLSNLVEVALHQQEIEKLEVVGDTCRQLEILYLCNNFIPKIENLNHLKKLTYINLAVNNIKVIEGLEGCESLERLDLTLNFIGDLTGVKTLQANMFLENLYLTGNPCCDVVEYKKYVIDALPQLMTLDGSDIVRSMTISARQDKKDATEKLVGEKLKTEEQDRIREEMRSKGIDPYPERFNEKNERVYGHSAEERIQILRETEEKENRRKNQPVDPNSISGIHQELNKKRERPTVAQELEKHGRVIMRNEGKLGLKMDDEDETKFQVTVEVGKFLSTELLKVDADVNYIQVMVKDKMVRLPTPHDIAVDKITVQRAKTTGALQITMPYAAHVLHAVEERKNKYKWCFETDKDDKVLEEEQRQVRLAERDAEQRVKVLAATATMTAEAKAKAEKAESAGGGWMNTKSKDDLVKTRPDLSEESMFKEVKKTSGTAAAAPKDVKPATNLPARNHKGQKIESFVEEIE